MKLFLFLPLFLLCPLFGEAFASEKPRMCYFQLTSKSASGRSGDEGEKLADALNVKNNETVFKSYFGQNAKDTSADDAFEAMVEDNKNCSALVISGYHTGNFYSQNEDREGLDLTFLEKLACNPKYESWFSNVKALYLHGSRTVNDQFVKDATDGAGDNEALAKRLVGNPDQKLTGAVRRRVRAASHSFAHTLDEHNPLSPRYLRSFPGARIFGFSGEAGLGQGDEHIAKHIEQVLGAEAYDNWANDSSKATERFKAALEKITADDCDSQKWTTEKPARAFKPNTKDEEEARRLGCALINNNQILNSDSSSSDEKNTAEEKIHEALNEIVKDKALSHRLMHNIFETFLSAKKRGGEALPSIKKNLTADSALTDALTEKIKSPIFPSLKKVDYIKLLKELRPENKLVSKSVQEIVQKTITMSNEDNNNKKALALLLADQLSQYELLSGEQIKNIRDTLPGDNGTGWQKRMKIVLAYRSYAAKKGSDTGAFPETLEESKKKPWVTAIVADEILRDIDLEKESLNLETAFKAAEAIADPKGEYFYKFDDSKIINQTNNQFVTELKQHIQNIPEMTRNVNRYLQESFVASDDATATNKGKKNFQANLLWALYNMEDDDFPSGRKAYFSSMDKSKLNEPSQKILESINRELSPEMFSSSAPPGAGTTSGRSESATTYGTGAEEEIRVTPSPDSSAARPASRCGGTGSGGTTRCLGRRESSAHDSAPKVTYRCGPADTSARCGGGGGGLHLLRPQHKRVIALRGKARNILQRLT